MKANKVIISSIYTLTLNGALGRVWIRRGVKFFLKKKKSWISISIFFSIG